MSSPKIAKNENLKELVLIMFDKSFISQRERDRYLDALYKSEKVLKYETDEERKKNKNLQSRRSAIRRELLKILKFRDDFEK